MKTESTDVITHVCWDMDPKTKARCRRDPHHQGDHYPHPPIVGPPRYHVAQLISRPYPRPAVVGVRAGLSIMDSATRAGSNPSAWTSPIPVVYS